VFEGVRAQGFVVWHLDCPSNAAKGGGKELEALLDEIDDLLEENAAEFVDSYVQRGGQ
jgi:ubiquitin-like protein Pup